MIGELVVTDDVPGEFAARFSKAFRSREGGAFVFVMSGGDTARACYERLAEVARAEDGLGVDWRAVHVYWSDERCVPDDDPASNYRAAREALLDRVGPVGSVHPMRCDEGGERYGEELAAAGALDFVHLGLGPDGHTASLFPKSAALGAGPDELACLNSDPSGLNPHPRMTLTYGGIARGRLVVFTVRGEERSAALVGVAHGEQLPAAKVRADEVLWLVDPAAARGLS